MKRPFCALLVLTAFATPALGAGVQLSIQDGKVTLDAQDVTIRQILTEWARVGNTRIVNVERLAGGPITLKFEGLPEKQALDTILRTVPGYVAAPRDTLTANASMYETILVMATTTAVAPRTRPGAAVGGVTPAAPFGSGAPAPGSNVTQLRPTPFIPAPTAENPEPEEEDRALAAAAAAGLIPGTGAAPAEPPAAAPIALPPPLGIPNQPGTVNPNQPGAVTQPAAPATTPLNPWNAPTGTPQPSLAPPPPPAAAGTQPISRPRPPQPDNR